MTNRFWPSLKLIAQVRIARGILCNLEFDNIFPNFLRGDELIDLQYMHQILSSLYLSNKLENLSMGIIKALGKEIGTWCSCHRLFLVDANVDYWNRMQWYSHGTINRLETARAFIQDENVNIGQRFELACAYYLEADARTLFENMSSEYRNYFRTRKFEDKSRRFWVDALETSAPLDWLQISRSVVFRKFYKKDTQHFFHKNFIGLLQLFPKLENSHARLKSILNSIGRSELHPFDFYLCLSQMDDNELDNVFNYLSKEQRLSVCKSFLHWPLQSLFLKVLERLRTNMSAQWYFDLFVFILCEKLTSDWFDYDYVDLVKQIWSSVSYNVKRFIERREIFQYLEKVLDYDGQ
ncbi:uncharacterized protein NPIL_694181 [Nephila pilipes]|uniref:Uncharacterized protein n=1 Tax=Nephila pilipes TaxID=299642 RepID=A0A8X6ND15_NEPPI|nr:uncharacterized protein NPIL_694181 [Nephila pilipes]